MIYSQNGPRVRRLNINDPIVVPNEMTTFDGSTNFESRKFERPKKTNQDPASAKLIDITLNPHQIESLLSPQSKYNTLSNFYRTKRTSNSSI